MKAFGTGSHHVRLLNGMKSEMNRGLGMQLGRCDKISKMHTTAFSIRCAFVNWVTVVNSDFIFLTSSVKPSTFSVILLTFFSRDLKSASTFFSSDLKSARTWAISSRNTSLKPATVFWRFSKPCTMACSARGAGTMGRVSAVGGGSREVGFDIPVRQRQRKENGATYQEISHQ